ncbi:MAG: hypothetical protein CVV02_06220 [Firmicutes bacterium HGW-Firmicutes-7]|nr:MAG: hypothetical protein CVV02_06220 [Firmicutes bacterium HGW-Firmicutes-7]
MATDKRPFTMRMTNENFNKIKYIAESNKRSIAMQIEYLIEQEIIKFESQYGLITINDINDSNKL